MSARVIRIFDRRRIAVNLGTTDGIATGEKLRIYTPADEIVDPDSGESLGAYRRLKATIIVREVFEKFCVASPPNRREEVAVPGPADSSIYGMFSRRTETRLVPSDLNVDSAEIDPLPTGTEVHVGDIVERDEVTAQQE